MTVLPQPRKHLVVFGQTLPPMPVLSTAPDYEQASASWLRGALAASQQLPSGGWYAVDATRAIGPRPSAYSVDGRALVLFRLDGRLFAAPEACPHLGASLAGACVREGKLVCPWHGLRLDPEGHQGWKTLPTHDDGVLCWVQLPGAETPTAAPLLPVRPHTAIDAVVRVEARCETRDVIQNRLDPWHGTHFHPHSFARLHVIEQREDEITVRVSYRVLGPVAVEVDARFHCPDRRTIAMTIVRGEGTGSVVETHATPIGPGRTAVLEATFAASDCPGFARARVLAPWLRPLMRRAALRLWTEDAAYAERLYALRAAAHTHADAEEPSTPSNRRRLAHLPRRA